MGLSTAIGKSAPRKGRRLTWRVLDLFCGAGGAAMGLHRAWPDAKILGIDIAPQKNYPFDFEQADALDVSLEGFDFIWASSPCQLYSAATGQFRARGFKYPDVVPAIRARLESCGVPYVIENVVGAPLKPGSIRLCGLSFGLRVLRHRYFETSFAVLAPPHITHRRGCVIDGEIFSVFGKRGSGGTAGAQHGRRHKKGSAAQWRAAMGIDWMLVNELSEAIPPAYSEFIAKQVRR
jgi:DNA (cytosine-5)-methyltransferase 1